MLRVRAPFPLLCLHMSPPRLQAQRSVSKCGEMEQNSPDWLLSKHWVSSSDFMLMAFCVCWIMSPMSPHHHAHDQGRVSQHLSLLQHKRVDFFLSSCHKIKDAFPTIKIDSQCIYLNSTCPNLFPVHISFLL